jgi:hypothetical protein
MPEFYILVSEASKGGEMTGRTEAGYLSLVFGTSQIMERTGRNGGRSFYLQ